MGSLLDIAYVHTDYMLATASTGAAGHVAYSATRSIRRSILRPLQALRRALGRILFYSIAIAGLWIFASQASPATFSSETLLPLNLFEVGEYASGDRGEM